MFYNFSILTALFADFINKHDYFAKSQFEIEFLVKLTIVLEIHFQIVISRNYYDLAIKSAEIVVRNEKKMKQ